MASFQSCFTGPDQTMIWNGDGAPLQVTRRTEVPFRQEVTGVQMERRFSPYKQPRPTP